MRQSALKYAFEESFNELYIQNSVEDTRATCLPMRGRISSRIS